MSQKKYDEAVKQFDQALALDPTFKAARENRDIAISRAHEMKR
jgi:lipoprotein NlpI